MYLVAQNRATFLNGLQEQAINGFCGPASRIVKPVHPLLSLPRLISLLKICQTQSYYEVVNYAPDYNMDTVVCGSIGFDFYSAPFPVIHISLLPSFFNYLFIPYCLVSFVVIRIRFWTIQAFL